MPYNNSAISSYSTIDSKFINHTLAKLESNGDQFTCKLEWFSMIPSGHISIG